MAGLPPFHDGRSMAAAVCGMPEEEKTMGSDRPWDLEVKSHYRALGMCPDCGGPLVDDLCARRVAHGTCEARVFSKADMGRAEVQDPPPDLVADALAIARGELSRHALHLDHLKAIVALLDQRNETIKELLKP